MNFRVLGSFGTKTDIAKKKSSNQAQPSQEGKEVYFKATC
jgi:hypothetical protein